MISRIIKVLVRVISQSRTDNPYLDLNYSGYHKNVIQKYMRSGLNNRIQGHLFTSYWIQIVPTVFRFILQKVLTHVKQVVQSGPAFCSCSEVRDVKNCDLHANIVRIAKFEQSELEYSWKRATLGINWLASFNAYSLGSVSFSLICIFQCDVFQWTRLCNILLFWTIYVG